MIFLTLGGSQISRMEIQIFVGLFWRRKDKGGNLRKSGWMVYHVTFQQLLLKLYWFILSFEKGFARNVEWRILTSGLPKIAISTAQAYCTVNGNHHYPKQTDANTTQQLAHVIYLLRKAASTQ